MTDPVATVVVAVRDALADLEPGARVLVGCSGGADSLALAAGTARVAASRGLRAGAVVVDHGWTTAASRAGRRATGVLADLGLDPVELVVVDSSGTGGPEAAARTARYAALVAAAQRHTAQVVLLGHTLDDQAESVLLGLARGSGTRSLAGMPAEREVAGVQLRRPFLGLRRDDTAAACRALRLRPWSDPANADPRYARVRARELVRQLEAGLGPGVAEALARSADLLRQDADALDDLAAQLDRQVGPEGGTQLEVAVLLAAAPAVRRRALLRAAVAAGCPAGALGSRHAAALDRLLHAGSGARADLPGGIRAVRSAGKVTLIRH